MGPAVRRSISTIAIAAAAATTSRLSAQSLAVRPIGPVVATSSIDFGTVAQLVALGGGPLGRPTNERVLINDSQRHRVIELTSTLDSPTTVIDSAPGHPNSYGTMPAALLPFRGDSALFYDPTTKTILVIDPRGMVGRVLAPPFGGTNVMNGLPRELAYSPPLGLVYTAGTGGVNCRGRPRPTPGGPPVVCDDSAWFLTADVASHKVDTLLFLSTGSVNTLSTKGNIGTLAMFPFADAFTVTRDGAVAILHTREYRLEWINADGTRTQSPRLPFDWHQITDAERSHIIDSATAYRARDFDTRLAKWIKDSTVVGGKGPTQTLTGMRGSGPLAVETTIQIPLSRPSPPAAIERGEVPDFLPPTTKDRFVLLADGDNVWVRLRPTTAGGDADPLVYDVFDRTSALIDRVRVPAGRTIVGFSPGFAYLVWHDAGVVRIEKARIR